MKKGFTLAEVLITLGVVGVVAALTIPNAMQSYQKRVWVTQLQRSYNQISNAAKQFIMDNEITLMNEGGSFSVPQFFNKYFNANGKCENANIDKCLAPSYKSLDGSIDHVTSKFMSEAMFGTSDTNSLNQENVDSVLQNPSKQFFCVNVDTGATICMTPMTVVSGCTEGVGKCDHGYSVVLLDVNGKVGPNIKGRDFYQFYLYSDGKIGNNHDLILNAQDVAARCGSTIQGYGDTCFTRIVQDGWRMDY